jgi:hypothetical protein
MRERRLDINNSRNGDKTEETATALFPFHNLQHQFLSGGFGGEFDAAKEKRPNENMRRLIEKLKERAILYLDESYRNAVRKAEHCLRALHHQIALSAKAEQIIDMVSGSSGPNS